MFSIRKIALLGLPLVAFAGAASVAHADPCLSLSGCIQQDVSNQVSSAKDSAKNSGNQLVNGVRDQAKQRWNNATETEREKLLAKGGALTSTGANATEKLNNAEKTVKERWNNASTAERQKILAQRDKLTNAGNSVNNAEKNVQDRVKKATTLPSIPSLPSL